MLAMAVPCERRTTLGNGAVGSIRSGYGAGYMKRTLTAALFIALFALGTVHGEANWGVTVEPGGLAISSS